MTRSAMEIAPPLISSSPAIERGAVDLPDPDASSVSHSLKSWPGSS
jgi:hypothetical protein